MTPGTYDLALYRGDSYTWRVRLWQDAGQTIPVDLAGATVAAEIREKTAGVHVVELGCVVTLPNIVDVTIEPGMYVECPQQGVWDLQLTFADGDVHTVLRGAVSVTGDVTDSLLMPVRAARVR